MKTEELAQTAADYLTDTERKNRTIYVMEKKRRESSSDLCVFVVDRYGFIRDITVYACALTGRKWDDRTGTTRQTGIGLNRGYELYSHIVDELVRRVHADPFDITYQSL